MKTANVDMTVDSKIEIKDDSLLVSFHDHLENYFDMKTTGNPDLQIY